MAPKAKAIADYCLPPVLRFIFLLLFIGLRDGAERQSLQ